jgi:hypothetical protein
MDEPSRSIFRFKINNGLKYSGTIYADSYSYPLRSYNKLSRESSDMEIDSGTILTHYDPENVDMEIDNPCEDNLCEFTPKKYRNSILKKAKYKCVISRVDLSECECAHIIPRKICDALSLNYKYSDANGLLLSRNLHTSFDNHVWTFDVFDYIDNNEYVSLSIISKTDKKSFSINNYKYNNNGLCYYKVPKISLPYLYIHYCLFLEKNYKSGIFKENDTYKKLLEDKFFTRISNDINYFFGKYFTKQKLVLDKCYDSKSQLQYLVLMENKPFKDAMWMKDYKVDKQLKEEYNRLIDKHNDPDY